jgi:kynureninase
MSSEAPATDTRNVDPASLHRHPNALAPFYSRFRVAGRLLLTGHSHQAWPDAGLVGQKAAWEDAAMRVDEKWEAAFARADRVRQGYRSLLDDPSGSYSLAASTHDLLVRWLSALPLSERPVLVTTDAEFHSMRRQLARLEEEGVSVTRVPAEPAGDVGHRLAAAICDRTAAVLASTVFFTNARRAGGLDRAAAACRLHGAQLLLDVYHQLNVVPFSIAESGLEDAYFVGGGYKYCQLGEGNAFLRSPAASSLRPVATGWYAEFGSLSETGGSGRVTYGDDRFAGATYDPTSHYRAAAVLDFFRDHGLTPELLRRVSQHQIGLLCHLFDGLDLDPSLIDRDRSAPVEELGGFLALRTPRAGELAAGLRSLGVLTDYRNDVLRLGPAPYLSDRQLEEAMALLGRAARSL